MKKVINVRASKRAKSHKRTINTGASPIAKARANAIREYNRSENNPYLSKEKSTEFAIKKIVLLEKHREEAALKAMHQSKPYISALTYGKYRGAQKVKKAWMKRLNKDQ